MNPVTPDDLLTALNAAVTRPWARRALVDLARITAGSGTVARIQEWGNGAADAAAPPRFTRRLAMELAHEAAARPSLADSLRMWVTVLTAAGETDGQQESGEGGGLANSIAGDSRVTGPVVQARHIRGDLHIHAPPPTGTDRDSSVPRQLPPLVPHFTGRDGELAALEAKVRDVAASGPALAVLTGQAGIGKTALATHWLTGRAGHHPDGQFHADLQGHSPGVRPLRPGEVLGRFLRALGVTRAPAELPEQAALWRSVTAGLDIAVLLDNAFSAAQVRPLLSGSPGSLVVVTSRLRLAGLGIDGAVFHQVEALTADDCLALLTRRLGADRVRREPEAARRLALLCAGLPLAVGVAAARLVSRPTRPLATMVGALERDDASRLATLRLDAEHAVEAALDESYRQLTGPLARAYRMWGTLPIPDLDASVAGAVLDITPREAAGLLDGLTEVSLVEEVGHDSLTRLTRYRFHDLVRAHAAHRAGQEDTEEARDEAVRRLADHFLAAATAAEELLSPSHRTLARDYAFPPRIPLRFADEAEALRWLDSSQARLMAVLRAAVGRGLHRTAWQLADAIWPLVLRLRPYELWIEAYGIGREAALRDGDRAGISRMLTSGGTGLRNTGRHDEALGWFTEALEAARQDGDRRAEAQALHGLGQTQRLANRLAEAAEYFAEALVLREAVGYRRGAALTRICLGDVALASDDRERARAFLARARDELLAEGDTYEAARALAFLGLAQEPVQDAVPDPASPQLLLALGEFEATGAVPWQGRVLEMLGERAEAAGDQTRARTWYRRSLARYASVGAADTGRLSERLRGLPPDPDGTTSAT
ncbi:ATP-binding protein [Streptomyces griseiscabiei]|uniref:Tetratricopeptide repeat protein n=1 Tax=Streptomyces griseiscabiei TaxID=2993540 RepID=A0ABU4L8C0_9ACTN|nr:tetratricopeptide repeat protein [Streptomyces griseiscabiei]MDX2912007.1 tetratricopeptide repeat protein [Streptomyces griseiscabiei]